MFRVRLFKVTRSRKGHSKNFCVWVVRYMFYFSFFFVKSVKNGNRTILGGQYRKNENRKNTGFPCYSIQRVFFLPKIKTRQFLRPQIGILFTCMPVFFEVCSDFEISDILFVCFLTVFNRLLFQVSKFSKILKIGG